MNCEICRESRTSRASLGLNNPHDPCHGDLWDTRKMLIDSACNVTEKAFLVKA